MSRRALFIGRWQPAHKGHMWLINQKLDQGVPVLIAVRDIPPDEKNPFTTEQTVTMLKKLYSSEDVEVIAIPDIESVNYGRGVGYQINEFVPTSKIGYISATQIRDQIKAGDATWKDSVDASIQDLVVDYLSKS